MSRFIVLTTLILAAKLAVVAQLYNHPLVQPDVGLDTAAYAELAQKVRSGDLGLGPGLYYVSPLYIYFLAAGLALTDSFTAVRVIQVALGTLAVWLVFATAQEWFGRRAGWLAAGLAALTGLFTFYEALILQASLDVVLTSAALLCLTFGLTRQRGLWYALSGIVFGLASLNRPNMLLAAGGLAAVLLATRRIRPAAFLVAGVLVGLAPVAVRNGVVAGEWSAVSSHGGLNFYIGNGEGATGFYRQVPGITPDISGQQRDARRVAERALGRPVSDAEASDYFFSLAWNWMREHPGRAIALFIGKLGWVFHAQHIALPYSFPFYAQEAPLLRVLAVGPWLLIPLGLAGLVFCAPAARRQEYVVWLSFVPAYAAAVAVFLVAERYRLPVLVPLCIGAGAAIDRAMQMAAARRLARIAGPAAVVAILLIITNWPHGLHDGRVEESIRMAERLVIIGRYDEAEAWIRRIEPEAPRPSSLHFMVGVQYLRARQTGPALEHLTKAQQLDPGQPNVEYALGQALLNAGQYQEAIPHLRRGFDAGAPVPLAGYDLAVALKQTGDQAGAADVIRRISPGEDVDVEAWLRLGRFAVEVNAPDVAEPFFRHAVQIQPGSAAARVQYGLNLLVLKRFDEAARELGEAVRLDPRDPDALAHLAYAEISLGRPADARAHISAALAIDPTHAIARQLAAAIGR